MPPTSGQSDSLASYASSLSSTLTIAELPTESHQATARLLQTGTDCLLYGPLGTGKTTTARLAFSSHGQNSSPDTPSVSSQLIPVDIPYIFTASLDQLSQTSPYATLLKRCETVPQSRSRLCTTLLKRLCQTQPVRSGYLTILCFHADRLGKTAQNGLRRLLETYDTQIILETTRPTGLSQPLRSLLTHTHIPALTDAQLQTTLTRVLSHAFSSPPTLTDSAWNTLCHAANGNIRRGLAVLHTAIQQVTTQSTPISADHITDSITHFRNADPFSQLLIASHSQDPGTIRTQLRTLHDAGWTPGQISRQLWLMLTRTTTHPAVPQVTPDSPHGSISPERWAQSAQQIVPPTHLDSTSSPMVTALVTALLSP